MLTQPCEIDQVLPKAEQVDYSPIVKKVYALDVILVDVCAALDEPVAVVISKSRKREHVACRMIYCHVAKEKTGKTHVLISALIGDRDHTTVTHSLQAVKDFLDVKDPQFMAHWNKYLQNSTLFNQYDFR